MCLFFVLNYRKLWKLKNQQHFVRRKNSDNTTELKIFYLHLAVIAKKQLAMTSFVNLLRAVIVACRIK